MRRVRVFVPQPLEPGARLALPAGAATHVSRVLRMTPGDPLVLFNGDGHDYPARLSAVGRRQVEAEVLGREAVARESPLAVHLGQGVSKGERMDWVMQKAVELGVAQITPVITRRTVVRLDEARWRRRLEHWRGVIVAACEQCGRARLPRLNPPLPLDRWLEDGLAGEARLVLDPRARDPLSPLAAPGAVRLLVGPEGGLAEAELQAARGAGFQGLSLGPRVLRTETAALAALTVVQARWGDLGGL